MNRQARRWRLLVGVAVLGIVLWRTGTGPFVDGLSSLDGRALLLGVLIAVPVTVASAWRWHLVARELGVGVDLRPAVASYYRSQFLNTTLPGGILGDLHRGVRHGREAGDTGRGLRAVAWERLAGQVVQIAIATVALLLLPSPVRSSVPVALVLLATVIAAVAVVLRLVPSPGSTQSARVRAAVRADVRCGLLVRRAWPGIVLASALAVAGHVLTYLVAARAVGVTTPAANLLPLVLLVLLAAGVPFNVAGWGPREGMAAWSFAAAGLGADQGVATAVAYGVMVLVASLPGAVVLLASARGRNPVRAVPSVSVPTRVPGGGPAGG
jgi:uncharacterized membrane protein YbhN (UPF0104 family)